MSKANEEKPIGFMATQWSLVHRAGKASADTRRASLETLLQRYLPALRAHLTIDKKLPNEKASDLLQGFIADKVVEQNLVALADPAKGKFRSFLLIALNRYVIDQLRRDTSAKRGGAGGRVGEFNPDEVISPQATPSEKFDVIWARELVARALELMRQECQQSGQEEMWGVFECRLLRPAFDATEPMPYDELIQRFSLQTPLQAYNLLTSGKRMFMRMLRSAATEYLADDATADEEINDLKSILAHADA